MASSFSTEVLYEIWNDDEGTRFEVGEDRDSLGLVEIRSVGPDRSIEDRMTFEPECARQIANAMLKFLAEKKL